VFLQRMLVYRGGVHAPRVLVLVAALVALMPAAAFADDPGTGPSDDPGGAVPTTPVAPAQPAAPVQPIAPRSPIAPPNPRRSWAGRLLVVSTARATPGPTGRPIKLVQPIAPLGAGPVWLQVRGVRVVSGVRWVNMLLASRPNGLTGWMRASDFTFRPVDLRVVVDTGDRRLTLFRRGKAVRSFPVAVGTAKNPTPHGRFAVAEVIPTGDPKGFLGPTVMALTSFSETLNEFAGGNGRVAIHGTSQPELIGRRVSHGCIRMSNADIQALARVVRGGTPVIVRA
jgi:lipoprotein-anchoring transpeptidase ErfK/SrfK